MKISFITTVLNEENTISEFLDSLSNQTKKPDEIIIVDGGSSDRTFTEIKNHPFGKLRTRKSKIKNKIEFKFLVKKGNRSVGRNEAVKNARGELILCSDAGCMLDKNWIKEIIAPFGDHKIDVVAGYYRGMAKNAFEKALLPYVLVMEDKLNSDNFLPSARSIAFKKNIWEKVGGFDERFSNNEDFVFAKKLRKTGAKISFAKKAIVFWKPRKNLKEAFVMFYRFAKGDSEAGIIRPKVIAILVRYLIVFLFLFLFLFTHSLSLIIIIAFLFINYVLWAGFKNYRYVDNKMSIFYLIILQFLSDLAVIMGTFSGLFGKVEKVKMIEL